MPKAAHSNPQIKDFVTVRDCPTVVRFSDLAVQNNSWISDNFFLNDEIKTHLKVIQRSFAADHGCGIFLIGSYGTGKSHFLAYLIQQLQSQTFSPAPQQVFYLSLLDYAAEESLESIIGAKLGLSHENISRSDNWRIFQDSLKGGLLLVIDELSEFLRAKPSVSSFTEDIRFLQFLGEWAQGEPFWLLAAMQEQIEHTGDLEHSLYRKIKDRFPLRLMLSATHFADLLGNHLLVKNDAYPDQVKLLCQSWHKLYPQQQQGLEQIQHFYPLHPMTISLMEEVRDGFSQTRGMVEFVLTQMSGETTTSTQPFIFRPWGELLSADFIVDHFQDLFELQPEFLPLSQKLFPYYREHLHQLFPTTMLSQLANRIIKLLVLVDLSPSRTSLSVEDTCYWLLLNVSQLQPEKNQQIVAKIFTKLVEQGRFIDKTEQGYCLNLKQDVGAQFDKQLNRQLADLPQDNKVLLEEGLAALTANEFPLMQLETNRWQPRTVNWHFHPRQFWICLGTPPSAPQSSMALCILLPWQQQAADANTVKNKSAQACFMLQPKAIHSGDELRTLVALQRMQQQPLSKAIAKRTTAQLKTLRANFITQLHNAYLQAVLQDQNGQRLQFNASNLDQIDLFLELLSLTLLRRTLPGFERYAPCHGPLPKAAYLSLMRYASDHDVLQEDAVDYVKLIREAYWLPMGLIRRQGKHYQIIPQLENHQLVKRLQPLLSHDSSPGVIHEELSQPILGLVEDQVNLLLLFLLLQGELEITRQQQSYYSLFETFPNPLQYDRVCLSYGLNQSESEQLQLLSESMGLKLPKQWTSLAQKHLIYQLQEVARDGLTLLTKTKLQLQQLAVDSPLTKTIDGVIKSWQPLLNDQQPLQAWQQFIYELDSLADFISAQTEAMEITGSISEFYSETRRYLHLISELKSSLIEDPHWQQQLHQLDQKDWQSCHHHWQQWLQDCEHFYEQYCQQYRQAHDDWWGQIDCSFEQWKPAEIAKIKQLELTTKLQKIAEQQRLATEQICSECSNLNYKTQCRCGFSNDNQQSNFFVSIQTDCQNLINEVEKELRLYFAQSSVRDRLRQWQQAGLETTPELIEYLQGGNNLPRVKDLPSLDKWLDGAELIKTINLEQLQTRLQDKNWQVDELLNFLTDYLMPFQQQRLRFNLPKQPESRQLASWILQQCLQFGQSLPSFMEQPWEEYYQAEWVADISLQRLHKLNYPLPLENAIICHLWNGDLASQQATDYQHPLVFLAINHLTKPVTLSLSQLISIAEISYSQHRRMAKLLGTSWSLHLEAVANSTPLEAVVDLASRLNQLIDQYEDAQFIIIDALSSFILPGLLDTLLTTLHQWQHSETITVSLSSPSTTSNFYDLLQQHSRVTTFEKINCLDELIHQQGYELGQLTEKAAVDIKHHLLKLLTKLDVNRPIILLSDHGFRLNADGHQYSHGGDSWLECLVPIVVLLAGKPDKVY